MKRKPCCCGCGAAPRKTPEYRSGRAELTLAELPVGAAATIAGVNPELRGRRKFADVGMVEGAELRMEAHAPFGGLLRVRVLEASMALHRDDAAQIVMNRKDAER